MLLFHTRTVRFPAAFREWLRNSPSQTRHSHIRNYYEPTEPAPLSQFPPRHKRAREHSCGKFVGPVSGAVSLQTTVRTGHDPEVLIPASRALSLCWRLLLACSPSSG